MLALFMAAMMAAAGPPSLEAARDAQDRATLGRMLNEYAAAAAKAPNDVAAQRNAALAASYLAQVAQEVKDKRQAKQAAERGIPPAERAVALRADSENYRLLGVLYGQAVTDLMSGLSYAPRARDAVNKAVEKAPKSSMAYLARGVGNYYLPTQLGGGAKAALPDFRKAVELDPKNAEAHLWLGLALRKDSQNAAARQAISKSLELAPGRIWAKQELEKTPAK